MGTAGYMSPEQVRGRPAGRSSRRYLRLWRDLVRDAGGETPLSPFDLGEDDGRHPERRSAGNLTDCAEHASGVTAGGGHVAWKRTQSSGSSPHLIWLLRWRRCRNRASRQALADAVAGGSPMAAERRFAWGGQARSRSLLRWLSVLYLHPEISFGPLPTNVDA